MLIYNLQQIGEDNAILEGAGNPDQVQRILIDVDLLGESGGIVGAQEVTAVGIDADAEVADAHLEDSATDDVGDSSSDTRVDLRRVVGGSVRLVVHADQEDTGDQRRRARTSGK